MSDPRRHPFFAELPLHDVTTEFSEQGLRQRLSHEIAQANWDDDTRMKLWHAQEFALDAHKQDERGDHPYSTHFLRVAIRIIGSKHFGIHDPDLLIAALLHDTVEDQAEFYASIMPNVAGKSPREHAFDVIGERFGENPARLIAAVTNPEPPVTIVTLDDKHEFYREHVREVLDSDDAAGIIKLSDFIDNCAGLKHNEDPERAVRLARKYLPLIPDFMSFVARSQYFDDTKKQSLLSQLERAEDRCLDLLAA